MRVGLIAIAVSMLEKLLTEVVIVSCGGRLIKDELGEVVT